MSASVKTSFWTYAGRGFRIGVKWRKTDDKD